MMAQPSSKRSKWDSAEPVAPPPGSSASAAEAAARVAEMLAAKKASSSSFDAAASHYDTASQQPPLPSQTLSDIDAEERRKFMAAREHIVIDINVAKVDFDGEKYFRKVDVNDYRNRYLVTRPEMMREISNLTNAVVMARGKWYPDRSLATEREPPLHLVIRSDNKNNVLDALQRIDGLLKQKLVVHSDFKRGYEERVLIGLEPVLGYNLRGKIVGPQGSYVKYIHQTTGVKVQLHGRGSGYKEPGTDLEADEPLYALLSTMNPEGLKEAKRLTEDLVKTVRQDFETWQQARFASTSYYQNYAAYPAYSADGTAAPDAAAAGYDYSAYANYAAAGGYDYSAYYQNYAATNGGVESIGDPNSNLATQATSPEVPLPESNGEQPPPPPPAE